LPSRKKATGLKACRDCKFLNKQSATECENCGSKRFAEVWDGLIILYNVESSQVAQSLSIKKPGRYALKLY
jgi:DNA-directed RNA polymerase subunit E"